MYFKIPDFNIVSENLSDKCFSVSYPDFVVVFFQDCLEVIAQHCKLDLERRDKWGRTVYEVASKACKDLLNELGTTYYHQLHYDSSS